MGPKDVEAFALIEHKKVGHRNGLERRVRGYGCISIIVFGKILYSHGAVEVLE